MKPPSSLRRLPVLVGPTASGKTALSLLLAARLNAEIISADSRQIFKLLDIGTAKPAPEDRALIRHHFVDELYPDQPFNAGEFGRRGRDVIGEIISRNKTPLVVGGSGLYLESLIDGFFDGPSADEDVRRSLNERLKKEGAVALLEELRSVDAETASKILPSNTRRLIRALEVYTLTGTPISALQKTKVEFGFTPVIAGLMWDRKALYARIDRRAEQMVRDGLVNEVEALQSRGFGRNLNALETVGYKEAFDLLEGKISPEKMTELIKQNSRRFAKRQLTWFRRDGRIRWFHAESQSEFPELANQLFQYYTKSP